MSTKLALGVDCGTQSLRVGLYRADGTLVAQAAQSYGTQRPHVNWAEQNPADWWNALCTAVPTCLREVGVAPDDVSSIACDGTSCTLMFCGADARPLRPAILWMDLRAAEEARQVEATQDPALDICGRHMSAEWLLPKTMWVRKYEPETYANAARIVEGVDWLTYRLCGRWVTSTGNAAGKRLWTPKRVWPREFYAALGIPELADKSPDAVEYIGDPLGTLVPEAADALGLTRDCVVTHAGMDGWVSTVGLDCLATGRVALTLGTSTVVIAETKSPRVIDGVVGPIPEGLRRGYSVYEGGQTSSGSTIGWMHGLVGARTDEEVQRLEEAAADVPPGSQGLVVFDAWRGNRTPYFDPTARGTICGLTLEHGAPHLYRAILEGCSYGIRNMLETLKRGGVAVRELRACGTGAGNTLWTSIIAGVTGCTVLVSQEKQATCVGAAMCAAVAGGAHADLEKAASAMAPKFETVEPGSANQAYEIGFEAYLETYQRMKDTMRRIAEGA